MRVGIAADHGGFELKTHLAGVITTAGHEIVDFGAHALMSGDDYPDFVVPLARAVAEGDVLAAWRSAAAGSERASWPTRLRASGRR